MIITFMCTEDNNSKAGMGLHFELVVKKSVK